MIDLDRLMNRLVIAVIGIYGFVVAAAFLFELSISQPDAEIEAIRSAENASAESR